METIKNIALRIDIQGRQKVTYHILHRESTHPQNTRVELIAFKRAQMQSRTVSYCENLTEALYGPSIRATQG